MKRILVAEDNPVGRELICEILEGLGYEVVEASDGREALQKIEEAKPDLVILDIQMPTLDGLAVVRTLRQDPRFATLRVMALTAFAMRGDREKILAAGFDAYMAKPVTSTALQRQIQEFFPAKPQPGASPEVPNG